MDDKVRLLSRSNDLSTKQILSALVLVQIVFVVLAALWNSVVWVFVALLFVIILPLARDMLSPYEMWFEVSAKDVHWTDGRTTVLAVHRSEVEFVSICGGSESDYSMIRKNDHTSLRLPDGLFRRLAVDSMELAQRWQRLWPEKPFFVDDKPLHRVPSGDISS